MSDVKDATVDPTFANNAGENSKTTAIEKKPTVPKIVKFDKLADDAKVKLLERVIADKKPHLDAQFLFQELSKANIMQRPSDSLVDMAFDIRRNLATGELGFMKAKPAIVSFYNQAITEKFTPYQARKLCFVLVCQNGQLLSDRQLRRYLPEEAKQTEHEPTATIEIAEAKKAIAIAEGIEGTTEVFLPAPLAKEIVDMYAGGMFTFRLYMKGKTIIKVKAGHETEQAPAAKPTGLPQPSTQTTSSKRTTGKRVNPS